MSYMNWKEFISYYRVIIIFLLILLLFFGIGLYRCNNPENFINYGDDNYCFVLVFVDSGRYEKIYAGTVTKTDYQKWVNGDTGTIFLHSTYLENRGWRLNISRITSMSNYGSAPNFLPMNFL